MMNQPVVTTLIVLGALVVSGEVGAGPIYLHVGVPQVVDSVVVERTGGYWERQRGDGMVHNYRATVTTEGVLRLELWPGTDSSETLIAQLSEGLAAKILALAESLPLEGVPERLAGARPFCGVVGTDAHSVTVGVFDGGQGTRVSDYHGCPVQNDRSTDGLLTKLRDFEGLIDEAILGGNVGSSLSSLVLWRDPMPGLVRAKIPRHRPNEQWTDFWPHDGCGPRGGAPASFDDG